MIAGDGRECGGFFRILQEPPPGGKPGFLNFFRMRIRENFIGPGRIWQTVPCFSSVFAFLFYLPKQKQAKTRGAGKRLHHGAMVCAASVWKLLFRRFIRMRGGMRCIQCRLHFGRSGIFYSCARMQWPFWQRGIEIFGAQSIWVPHALVKASKRGSMALAVLASMTRPQSSMPPGTFMQSSSVEQVPGAAFRRAMYSARSLAQSGFCDAGGGGVGAMGGSGVMSCVDAAGGVCAFCLLFCVVHAPVPAIRAKARKMMVNRPPGRGCPCLR